MGVERDRASRSLLWSCIDTFSQTGLSIVALVYLARELSVVQIGLGSLAVATAQLVALPLELLFQDALIRQQPLTPRHVGSAFALSLTSACTAAVLLIIAAPFIAHAYGMPELADLLRVAAVAIPFTATTALVGALLRREMIFAPLARRTLIGRVSGVVLGIVIAARGGGAWALVIMYAASIVLSTCILMIEWRSRPPLQWSGQALRELARFAVPSLVSSLPMMMNARLFLMIAGLYLSSLQLGWLSIGFRLVEELRGTLTAATTQLAMPLLARRADQPEAFKKVFAEATGLTALVLLPLYAGLMVLADDVLVIAFGMKWQAAAIVVQLLALSAMVVTLRQYADIAANALGRPGLNVITNVVVLLVSIGLLAVLGRNSAQVAAEIWAVRAVVLLVASMIMTRYVLSMSIITQLRFSALPLLAAVIMFATLMFARHSTLLPATGMARFTSTIALGALVYALVLWVAAPHLLKGLLEVGRGALLRRAPEAR